MRPMPVMAMADGAASGVVGRREVLRSMLGAPLAGGSLLLAGCWGEGSSASEVVLYSSVDDFLWFELKPLFENESGIRIRRAGDTEATKTFGLMQRLLDEGERPRADVWWSSEVLSTIRLAREEILAPYASVREEDFEGGWPEGLRGAEGRWYGFAQRARVIAYNPTLVDPDEAPRTLAELAGPRWNGRVAIADPRFGTTRTHVSAIASSDGVGALRLWLDSLMRNGVHVLDGNSTCARAVAQGDVEVCLTDTDDVWALQYQGIPIDMAYEKHVGLAPPSAVQGRGALVIPNTVGVVAGGPNPANARALVDFILSERVSRRIAESDSRNIPIRPRVARDYPELVVPSPWTPDWEAVADVAEEAVATAREALGR